MGVEEAVPSRHGIQVIGAGLSRTATQSLALALTELGYKTLHAEGFHPKIPVGRGTALTPTLAAATVRYFKGEGFQVLDPALELIDRLGIDAVVDLPWSECVPQLLQKHPHAKVIVTGRDSAAKWYKSYWEHFRWASVFPPALTHPFLEYWRRVTNNTGCGFVTRWPPTYPSERERADCFRAYERHVDNLKSIVPEESLLVFNVKEGWEPLCGFLGLPVPNTTFPRHDAYTFLHWHAGPGAFVATVYAVYAAILFCFIHLGSVALRRGLYRSAWHGRKLA